MSPDNTLPLSYQELDHLMSSGKLEVDSGYYDGLKALERGKKLQTMELGRDTIIRSRMVSQFLEEEQDSLSGGRKLGRSDRNIIAFIERFERQNTDCLPKSRGGRTEPTYRDKGLVGPRQFRRLLRRFEAGRYIPASLAPRYQGRKTEDTKWTAEEIKYHLTFAFRNRTSSTSYRKETLQRPEFFRKR